ncbi:MAG: PAS domain-containing protein [Terracidiphilus sp.]
MKTLSEALRTGERIDIEHRVKTVDGTWKWLRARGSPFYGSTGEIIRWYGGCEDIDKLK